MSALVQVNKDKDAVLDYSLDYQLFLESADTLQTSQWTVEGDGGPTIQGQYISPKVATVWLVGGTLGKTYKVNNRVTTAGGRTDDNSILVKIVER